MFQTALRPFITPEYNHFCTERILSKSACKWHAILLEILGIFWKKKDFTEILKKIEKETF